jgi:hypothetical protein
VSKLPNPNQQIEGSTTVLDRERSVLVGQKLEPPKRILWTGATHSAALIAFILFVAVNWLSVLVPSPDRYDWPNHHHAWWMVQDWRSLKAPPDLVLIGSSTVYKSVNGADANLLHKPIDEALNHRSRFLEQALLQRSDRLRSTFSLCTPGQMPSDTYAVTKTLLQDNFKPKTVVWGIFARDFLDTTFFGPLSSAVARYMNRISVNPVVESDRVTFWSRVNDGLTQIFPLTKKREDALCLLNGEARTLGREQLEGRLGMSDKRNAPIDNFSINNPFFELVPGALVTDPDYQERPPKDSTSCDRLRFLYFDEHIFKVQCDYFERVLVLCKTLGIRLIVIGMPVTEDNLRQMPPGSRKRVMETVKAIMQRNDVEFHDFSGKGLFARNEFADLMHLNCLGGQKVLKMLADNVDWDKDNQSGKRRDDSRLSNANGPL